MLRSLVGSEMCIRDSRGEGRQAAFEEGAVLPVERVGAAAVVVAEEGLPVGRVGAAAAVDCSCRTYDLINTSPPTRDRKTEEQSNSGAIIPPPPQETEKRRGNLFVSAKKGCSDKRKRSKQSPNLLSQKKGRKQSAYFK